MNTEIAGESATSPETGSEDKTTIADTLSEADMVANFMREEESSQDDADSQNDATDELEETPEQDVAEGSEQDETEDEESPEGNAIDDFLAGLDADAQEELAKKLGGRLGSRIGELTDKVSRLENLLTTERTKSEPFERKPIGENPHAGKNREELEETYNAADRTIQEGKKILRRNRDAMSDEVIYNLDGQDLTKAQVEDWIDNAEEAKNILIPDAVRELDKVEAYEQARKQGLAATKQVHPWIDEKDSDKAKHFEQITSGLGKKVRDAVPEVAPFLDIILADYTDAYWQRAHGEPESKQEEKPIISKGKKRPPGVPAKSAAPSARPATQSKKRAELLKLYESQGRMDGAEMTQFLAT